MADEKHQPSGSATVWEIPDEMLDNVSGGEDFYQSGTGAPDFAQNFACFAQNIGDFSQGRHPFEKPL